MDRELELPIEGMEDWRATLGPLRRESELTELLRVTSSEMDALFSHGRLIGITTGDSQERLVPAFQLRPSGLDPVIAEASHVLLRDGLVDPVTAASWFVTPNAGLENKTPLEFLADEPDSEREKTVIQAAVRARARMAS
jgi:hypothetical protein